MALRTQVNQKIFKDVIFATNEEHEKDWRVLVVDNLTLKMVSASSKMHNLSAEGIIQVEKLEKPRNSMSNEAIYFITPCKKSVKELVKDFQSSKKPKYSAAHIYFTENCSDDIFEMLEKIPSEFVKTLKEINMSFVPVEQQVYSLDDPNAFQMHYNPKSDPSKTK